MVCNILVETKVLDLLRLIQKPSLTVLMFHRIDEQVDHLGLCISPAFFEAQLKYLTSKYTVISMSTAIEQLESGTLAHNSIVISFDDGWRDNYTHAFPLLEKYKVPATIFVTFDAIEKGFLNWHLLDKCILNSRNAELDLTLFGFGKFPMHTQKLKEQTISLLHKKLKKIDNDTLLAVIYHVSSDANGVSGGRVMLSWQEINQMTQSGLITIGAHTVTHPILTQISLSQAKYEIYAGKKLIEEKTMLPVDFFAYPNGSSDDFNAEIINLVADSGYKAAFSTVPGNNYDLLKRYELSRMDVTYGMCQIGHGFSKNLFAVKISGVLQGVLFKS